jgi:putative phage-type endonuclease
VSLTPEQLEQRLNYICGSDCSTILGLNPWSNRIELWQEKTRRIVPKDISDKPGVKAGNFLEPAVRAWFEAESGLKVTTEPNLLVHPLHKWMAGNIDGWVGDDKKEILEIKTTNNDVGWGKHGQNKIPDYYLCQITHYMAVTCAQVCHVAVLIRGSDFRTYRFERNIELEDVIIEKEQEFWKFVISDNPPQPSTSDEVISFHGYTSVPESIIADQSIEAALELIEQSKNSIKSIEKEKEQLEAKVKLFMGKNENLLDSSGKIVASWKPTAPIKRFDVTSFKKDNEDQYSKYIKQTESSRRFSIKTNNEGI